MAGEFLIAVARGWNDGDFNRGAFRGLQRSAQADAFGVHSLTDDPETAELILFAERACFHRVIEWCLQIKAGRPASGKVGAPFRLSAVFAAVSFSASPPDEMAFLATTLRSKTASSVCVPGLTGELVRRR